MMIRLCDTTEVAEGQAKGFKLTAVSLLAVRQHGRLYLYENRCPHRGIPLEWLPDQFLDSSASLVQCATHGALFLIDTGECVAGPCAGQALRAIPCTEHDGGVWMDRTSATLRPSDD